MILQPTGAVFWRSQTNKYNLIFGIFPDVAENLGVLAMPDGCGEGRYHSFRTDMTFLSASLAHTTIKHTA